MPCIPLLLAKNAKFRYNYHMDSNSGGLSFEERQRQTAAEIARRKVMASYKTMPVQTQVTQEDFKKYHSAWQGYYQKYYSEYYANAAKQYIETEQLKRERLEADLKKEQRKAEILAGAQNVATANNHVKEDDSLKSRIRKLADEEERHKKRMKKWTPIIAGLAVVAVLLFLQYNRMIFAPIMAYVSPGNASETSITEVDPTVAVAVKAEPTLLIPKLNIDVPIDMSIDNSSAAVMEAMNHGVARFAVPGASALPGEVGNFVISGHSAGDIYSNNQYKFIFSGLERLTAGDLIYVDYQGQRYTYSVTKLDTVEPTDVQALVYDTDKPMLTLITCWPLGTSRYRLLVTAEQINPSTSSVPSETETSSSEKPVASLDDILPQNEPTFFESIWNWLTGR